MITRNFKAVEPVVVNSIRSLGQKEDIDFLNDPHPQTGSMAEGGAAAVESTSTEHLERGGPVAHAIVSPRHPAHHRDSFSDIYFTGNWIFIWNNSLNSVLKCWRTLRHDRTGALHL